MSKEERDQFFKDLDHLLDVNKVKYFRAYELADVGRECKGVKLQIPNRRLWRNIIFTAQVLDEQRHLDGVPYHVNSGYRDPNYNKAVGGVTKSYHILFNGIDVKAEGISPKDLAMKLNNLKYAKFCGIGLYKTFVHIDTRGVFGQRMTRWSGRGAEENWWISE